MAKVIVKPTSIIKLSENKIRIYADVNGIDAYVEFDENLDVVNGTFKFCSKIGKVFIENAKKIIQNHSRIKLNA